MKVKIVKDQEVKKIKGTNQITKLNSKLEDK